MERTPADAPPLQDLPDLACNRALPPGTQVWSAGDLDRRAGRPLFVVPDGEPTRLLARHGDPHTRGVVALALESTRRSWARLGAGRVRILAPDEPPSEVFVDGKDHQTWLQGTKGSGGLVPPGGGTPEHLWVPTNPEPPPTPPPIPVPFIQRLALVINGGDPYSTGFSAHVDSFAAGLIWNTSAQSGPEAQMHSTAVAMMNHLVANGWTAELLDNFDGNLELNAAGAWVPTNPQASLLAISTTLTGFGAVFAAASPRLTHELFVYVHAHGYRTFFGPAGGCTLYRPTAGQFLTGITEVVQSLPYATLLGWIRASIPANVNVTLFIDSCYSGRLLTAGGMAVVTGNLAMGPAFRRVQILTGAGSAQPAILGSGPRDSATEDFLDAGDNLRLAPNLQSVLDQTDQGALFWSSDGATQP